MTILMSLFGTRSIAQLTVQDQRIIVRNNGQVVVNYTEPERSTFGHYRECV